jgi:hypothetical protein
MLMIKRPLLMRSIAVLFWAISFGSSAQTNWPNGQTVRVIVPFPGGASTLDSVVRTVTPAPDCGQQARCRYGYWCRCHCKGN